MADRPRSHPAVLIGACARGIVRAQVLRLVPADLVSLWKWEAPASFDSLPGFLFVGPPGRRAAGVSNCQGVIAQRR